MWIWMEMVILVIVVERTIRILRVKIRMLKKVLVAKDMAVLYVAAQPLKDIRLLEVINTMEVVKIGLTDIFVGIVPLLMAYLRNKCYHPILSSSIDVK